MTDSNSHNEARHSEATRTFDQLSVQHDPLLGQVAGNYHLLARAGQGAFGTVYRARDVRLDRTVAVKFLSGTPSVESRRRFEQEARALARLGRHPGVVDIHAWGEHEGQCYLALEYLPESAGSLLARRPGGLPPEQARSIALQCAEALQEAHTNGVVHGDIKPSNILLDEHGAAKLCDFGLASLAAGTPLQGGSPAYLAPECAYGAAPTPQSDIYALGATLQALLTGQTKSPAGTANVPAQLRDAIARATAQDPALRYASAKDFANALRGLPRVERRRGLLRATVTVAMLAAAGVGFLMVESLIQPGATGTVALADARISLNRGEFAVARARFEEYLSSQPDDPEARYGLAYALLLEGDHTRAQQEFARLGETAMREEGKAAVAYMANGEAARPALEHAAVEAPGGYAAVLLSMLDMMAGNFDQARQRLDAVHEDELRFDWQRRQYLQTLGQLYYKSGDYTAAQEVFDRLEQSADGAPPAFAGDYADLSRERLESATRADTGEKLARLKELMKEAPAAASGDAWTSRPLRIWIAPVDSRQGLIAQESGLADVLPWRMSRALLGRTKPAITPVERGAEADILAEQEMSATLSNPDDAVRLGRVIGARLLLLSKVTRLFGKELMHVSVVDTETTLLAPVGEYEIRRDLDPDAWLGTLVKDLVLAVAKAYPLRGKVTASTNGPVLNIGTDAGVESGMVFRVADGTGEAVVSKVAAIESSVELRGVEASIIPTEGWRVEQVQESPHAL